jgi:3-oxoacyl-[acyl-carrier-protein] synthase-1
MRREPSPCAITAVGLATALGVGVSATWPRLVAGDQSRLTTREDLVPGRRLVVGQVAEPLVEVPPSMARYRCRNNSVLLTALESIESELRRAVNRLGPGRVGVVMGSSTSGIAAAEAAIEHRLASGALPEWFDYAQFEMGGVAEFAAAWLGVTGPSYTISTACSSGAKAIAAGRALLALGACDAVVAGGADTLCRLTANGFCALQAIADEPSNPFSVNREGLTLGEGAAVLLLERTRGGIQVLGAGETSDAHHMSAPHPAGAGAEEAMRRALDEAGLGAPDVAYVNVHGTGTPLNDAIESVAVHRVLGPAVPVSSTKPLVGHTLGASGAVEIAFCWMILQCSENGRLTLPPHCWDGIADPALPRLHLVARGETTERPGRVAVLSNSFGFGGSNCAILLGAGW